MNNLYLYNFSRLSACDCERAYLLPVGRQSLDGVCHPLLFPLGCSMESRQADPDARLTRAQLLHVARTKKRQHRYAYLPRFNQLTNRSEFNPLANDSFREVFASGTFTGKILSMIGLTLRHWAE